jgi:peptidoglycan/xylan/chitin deacetylase (PgdA/CDA1 family)/SAM-dependent methyltransferase/GT2 family glycosyltransferase
MSNEKIGTMPLAPLAFQARDCRGSAQQQPGVSIIVPVHNASATLEATLDSLLHQTYTSWEAIIVDDGSTDGTWGTAKHWAERDTRFTVLHQQMSGVSAARNRGLEKARYPFVLFLDGDDRVAPIYLERMAGALSVNPSLDAVHCGWQYVLASGSLGRPQLGSDATDLFQHFAYHCHFAIHACVLRRDLALGVGGFDSSLTTCEDWDFWQRVARTGARFGHVPEVLAFYYVRSDSASRDNRRCLMDACTVVERAHRANPHLRGVVGAHPEGLIPDCRDFALYNMVIWCGAREIGAGRDGLDFLDIQDLSPAPGLSAAIVAECILEDLPIGADRSEMDWPALWSRVEAPIGVFLAKLEARTRAPALGFATLRLLEKKIASADHVNSPLLVGSTYRVDVEVRRPFGDVFLPPEADRLICRLIFKGEPIGVVELPGMGVVSGQRIAQVATESHARSLLGQALSPIRGVLLGWQTARSLLRRRTLRLLYSILKTKPFDKSRAVRRLKREIVDLVKTNLAQVLAIRLSPEARESRKQWQERLQAAAVDGRAFAREKAAPPQRSEAWDKIFALPDPWSCDSEYEAVKYEQTLALLPEGVFANALEIGCAEGHFTLRLAPRVGSLTAVDISTRALTRAKERCSKLGNVTFQRLDLNTSVVAGLFDLVVCSELLYYIRDLPGAIARVLGHVRPGGFFLTTHARLTVDDPEGSGFAWDPHFTFGVETIANGIAAQSGIVLQREFRTPLYRIMLYQRRATGQQPRRPEVVESGHMGQMTPVAENLARWPGRKPVRPQAERARAVPILMYHRIAAEGPLTLERYRVTPKLFADQLTALYQAGYRTIGIGDWIRAIEQDEPLTGKPIILTFDDGYRDFLTDAMPLLRVHGFSATIFLVAERIGGVAGWDAEYGESASLLSWDEVRALQEAGIHFGCHSSLHGPLTGMNFNELTEDTVRARAILEEGLGTPVTTLAYPYGLVNEFVRQIVADLGFRAAFTCEPGVSRPGDDLLRLRRIEVPGRCTPERLVSQVNQALEEARL